MLADKISTAQETLLGSDKFSKNVLTVELRGPDCGNLVLTDLPGLIQSTEKKEDEQYIKAVEELSSEYMRKQNTVIVQCIQSDEDVENQQIRTLAREHDSEGKRTVGVLTKPDKVDSGKPLEALKEIMAGHKYALKLGYFAVRTPKQEELDSTLDKLGHSEAFQKGREIEAGFFRDEPAGPSNAHKSVLSPR